MAQEQKKAQEQKMLGKITFAEFGTIRDYPFLIGLQLGFEMSGCGVMDGGKYTVNISKECKWTPKRRAVTVTEKIEMIDDILRDAKVNYVSQLVNKPVEVTLIGDRFESFRILTEVL